MPLNYLDMLDEVRAIAQTGINYARSPYDLQQYRRLLELASGKYAEITGLYQEEIVMRFKKELGYITAKVGVQCALFNADGKMLLEKRVDDQLFGLPGGWVDTGETPEIAIVRELMEETGLKIRVESLLGFYTRLPGDYAQPHTSVHILYACTALAGEIALSHESLELGYFNPLTITNWHKDHGTQALDALKLWHKNSH
jgi:ADP-ribose pyrophosphatase YjhB (NUDIX family)